MEQRLGEEIISCGQHNRDPDAKPLIPEFRQDDGLQDIIDGLQEAVCAVIHNFQCETDIEQLKAQLAPFALVLIYCLPVWVLPALGYKAVWTILSAITFLMYFSLIGYKHSTTTKHMAGSSPAGSVVKSLSYFFFHFCLLSAVWAFVERLGVKRGFAADDISLALALSLCGGLAGAIVATILGDRLGKKLPHLMTTVLFIGILLPLALELGWLGFLIAVVLFSFGWSYCLAYQMASIGELGDRFAVLFRACKA